MVFNYFLQSRDGRMRWIHHEIKHIVSKYYQFKPCNKIHIVPHKMIAIT